MAVDSVLPVLREVLETMYFISPDYAGVGEWVPGGFHVGVKFAGDSNGRFLLSVSRDLAHRMAADFLVADIDTLEPSLAEATVRELANVACGAALAAWRPDQTFEFSVPFEIDDRQNSENWHRFCVFGGPEIAFGLHPES